MYHNVCADDGDYSDLSPSATSYFVRKSEFDRQLAEVRSSGGDFMRPDDLGAFYAADRSSHPSPRVATAARSVLVTFDDGWKDSVDVGGLVLERHRCAGMLFVTADFLGRPHFLSRFDLAHLGPEPFHVGSHARTHRMLSLLPEKEIRSELSDSKNLLEDVTGHQVDSLSIPSGAVDRRVRRIAAECGYRFVFDSEVRVNRRGGDALAIGRVPVMCDTPVTSIRRYVGQRLTREKIRRAVLMAPKRVLGLPSYERLRRRLLGEKPGQRVTH